MAVAQTSLAGADGYRVLGPRGTAGEVEEIWLGELEEPLALVVRLADGRRGLLLAEDVAGVSSPDETLTIAPDTQLLRLEPPHVEHDGNALAASWRTTGDAFDLAPPRSPRRRGERPLWVTVALMLAALTAIVCTLIGLDFLFAYLIGGRPPF
jgi:hypothetical protein